EVSSPGEDRPFYKISQFSQYMNSTVMVHLFSPVNGRRKITGKIVRVEDDVITLEENEELLPIPFAAMSKARLVPDYLLAKGGRSGK
ncbi:MAG: ribosome maturation factor, partial [Methylococcaceae bacterium]